MVTRGLENVNDPDFGKPKKVKINKMGGNPSGRDYYGKNLLQTEGTKLPKVSPEDEGQLSATETWDAIYKSMSPIEKGQWNNEQRKNKQRHETETNEPGTTGTYETNNQRKRRTTPKKFEGFPNRAEISTRPDGSSIC